MDPEPGVAAFDFDGTLVKGDSFPRFLAHLLGRRRFGLLLLMALPAMLSSYRLSGRDGAKSVLLSRTLAGLSVDAARAAAEEFARTLVARIRPVMAEVMAWHERQGHKRILVLGIPCPLPRAFRPAERVRRSHRHPSRSRQRRAAHRPHGRPERPG